MLRELLKCHVPASLAPPNRVSLNIGRCALDVTVLIAETLWVRQLLALGHPLNGRFLGRLLLRVTVGLESTIVATLLVRVLAALEYVVCDHLERIADSNVGRLAKQHLVGSLTENALVSLDIRNHRLRFATLVALNVLLLRVLARFTNC